MTWSALTKNNKNDYAVTIRDNQQWQAIQAPVFFEQSENIFPMLPVWRFTALYDRPDGEVEVPKSYFEPDGVLDWELRVKKKKASFSEQDKRELFRKYYYFENRHLDTRFAFEYPEWNPDLPRPVSDTYGDPQKDLEVLLEFRDRIMLREGLTKASPPRDIAQAFAVEIYRNWRGGGARNHPADVLTHRSWCLGAEITTGVLLRSLGVKTRGVRSSDHAMCEVFLDGKWCLIDSSNHFINHKPKSTCLLPTDYMRLSTDPCSKDHGDKISDYHRGFFYHFPRAHYGLPDGRWLEQSLEYLCPANAKAFYPYHHQYRFKTTDPRRLPILERNRRMLYRYDLGHNLMPGQSLRESVYIGVCDGITEFEFDIFFHHIDGILPSREHCADLELQVGDQRLRLDQAGQWPMVADWDRTAVLKVKIPVGMIKENAVNWLQLKNRSRGRIFRLPLTKSIAKPYIPPLL